MKSTNQNYGTVAVSIHWISALLILLLIGSGFRAANMTDLAAKAQILSIHAPLGMAILVLTLARIGWWWFADRKPDPISGSPAWQGFISKAVHAMFYVVIIGMAASGIGMFVLSGAGSIVIAGENGQLPNFWDYLPRVPHGIGARAMILLFIFHAGAALYHHLVLKDGLLKRMWFRR